MLKERINFGLSNKECMELEGSLKLNETCDFKRTFKSDKFGDIDVYIGVELGYMVVKVEANGTTRRKLFKKNGFDNNNDIFGVYNVDLNSAILISVNLFKEYDETSSSIGEYIVSHLDYLKYKKDVDDIEELYRYLEYYDFENPISTVYSSYILELLDNTKYFSKAGKLFDDKVDDGRLYMFLSEFEDEEMVKDSLNTLLNEDSTYIGVLNGILIGISEVKIKSNKPNPILQLVKDNINSNILYERIAKITSIIDDLEYINF